MEPWNKGAENMTEDEMQECRALSLSVSVKSSLKHLLIGLEDPEWTVPYDERSNSGFCGYR